MGILARYMPISVSTVDVLVGEGSLLPSIGHWLLFGGWPLVEQKDWGGHVPSGSLIVKLRSSFMLYHLH